jgi:hypothetical protein
LKATRWALLVVVGAVPSCSLVLAPNDLGAGCPSGTKLCGGVCEPLVDSDDTALSCIECGADELPRDGACVPFTTCLENEYESRAPSSAHDRECRTIRSCEPGEKVEAESTATSDRECSPCPAGSFSTEKNSTTCEDWRECEEGEHESLAPSPTRDRACSPCPAGSFPSPDDVSECLDSTALPQSVVELRVQAVDDLAFLEVNGILHPIGFYGQAEATAWRDVSEWFWGGQNQVRLFGINHSGPQSLEFELRLDDEPVFELDCELEGCSSRWEGGVFVDRDIPLPNLVLAPARTVTVKGDEDGALYLNDYYTGLSLPAKLKLPVGTHRLGLGVAADVPMAYNGNFYEETIEVGGQDFEVMLGDEQPIGAQYTARIAILPLRRARASDSEGIAVLSDAEIARFQSQFVATRDQWLEPFSYRLGSWDITLLPTEEEIEMVAPTFDSFPDYACDVLVHPKYSTLLSTYDIVIIHMSNYDLELNRYIGRDSPGMGDRCGQVQNGTSALSDFGAPSEALLNILLHAYERHHRTVLGRYSGLNGAHGASTHGFQYSENPSEPGWLEWYRYFIRGQAPEGAGQHANVELSAPVTTPDLYVGPFSSFRHGLWLAR